MKSKPLHNRDLSWLTFNFRVLLEAADISVPLIERLRFIAIFSSNLDEFFRVRVANLRHLERIDKKKINKRVEVDPQSILIQIHKEVDAQLDIYGKTLKVLLKQLAGKGLSINYSGNLPKKDLPRLIYFFRTHLLGYLQVQSLNDRRIFLNNRALYFVISAKRASREDHFLLNIPSDKVPRFHEINEPGKESRYYFIDDIIRHNLSKILLDYEQFNCYAIKLNKDADLQIEDEYEGELVEKIEKQVKKRNLGAPSRFLYDSTMPQAILEKLVQSLDLNKSDLFSGGRYHNLNDFFQISSVIDELEYERVKPIRNSSIETSRTVFEAINKQDQVLHFPYQSYDYILQFFNEAATHPHVESINVTFYRMAERSMIGESLISAAINGKKVNVFMEVKARFDEENNLLWARKMEAAGISIHYSIPGLKVHAKAALVTLNIPGKGIKYYGFYGTGNLNEGTAKIYCDHSLLTANPDMNKELKQVFDFLNAQIKPAAFKHLIVSQFGAPDRFCELIDREIANKKNGQKAEIIIKLNNLEEPRLINKLYEAAESGVKVTLIVRSICCLVPGNGGINVIRIVDRFLEHARIFYFASGGEEALYMGSSDWMSRNLYRRIEVTFPIYDSEIKKQLIAILKIQMEDNTKAVRLDKHLHNEKFPKVKRKRIAQSDIYDFLTKLNI